VGALTPQKQPDRFVEVVRSVRAEGRAVQALIVGDGPLAGDLAVLAADTGIELVGTRSDVPELLRRSDVLVFTSLPAGEGMPGVLIEAGLSGLPAVSTPVPGAASVLGHGLTGVIVDDSVASIAAAVGQLLDDPDRRAAMGAAARSRCESGFSLDLMAQRWRAALRPMVSGQERDEEEGQHHGRLPGDQSRVAQGREEIAERGSEEHGHHDIGPGECRPGDPQRPE
ncbi:MAG TPA: glycosyltransferase, partial [Acidimicrobiales bacterium]|nr:glycosyltransferase [Acidimicrobiales bacterium]